MKMMNASDIKWDLCCLCQSDKEEKLQTPKEEGLLTLERDLNDFKKYNVVPNSVVVSLDKLDDGSGIAKTLKLKKARYHKSCRSYCSSSRVKRLCTQDEGDVGISPKKLRSNETAHNRACEAKYCIICDGDEPKKPAQSCNRQS